MKEIMMDFASESDAREWAEENDYIVVKIVPAKSVDASMACVAYLKEREL